VLGALVTSQAEARPKTTKRRVAKPSKPVLRRETSTVANLPVSTIPVSSTAIATTVLSANVSSTPATLPLSSPLWSTTNWARFYDCLPIQTFTGSGKLTTDWFVFTSENGSTTLGAVSTVVGYLGANVEIEGDASSIGLNLLVNKTRRDLPDSILNFRKPPVSNRMRLIVTSFDPWSISVFGCRATSSAGAAGTLPIIVPSSVASIQPVIGNTTTATVPAVTGTGTSLVPVVSVPSVATTTTSFVTIVTAPVIAAPTTTIATLPPSTVPKFANCTALNSVYPHGVGRSGAQDSVAAGSPPVTTFAVDDALYSANRSLDRDGDGIACEQK
jgi:hypothetical protein